MTDWGAIAPTTISFERVDAAARAIYEYEWPDAPDDPARWTRASFSQIRDGYLIRAFMALRASFMETQIAVDPDSIPKLPQSIFNFES